MNLNQIINMAMRILMRKGINAGSNRAVGATKKTGKRRGGQPASEQGTSNTDNAGDGHN